MKTIANIIHNKKFSLRILDTIGNRLYYEFSDGFWAKVEYDSEGNEIYYENSQGFIRENKS